MSEEIQVLFVDLLINYYATNDECIHKQLIYKYEQRVCTDEESVVYDQTNQLVRAAVIYWMLISKPLVSKDIAKLIGRMVYNSRYTPTVWLRE